MLANFILGGLVALAAVPAAVSLGVMYRLRAKRRTTRFAAPGAVSHTVDEHLAERVERIAVNLGRPSGLRGAALLGNCGNFTAPAIGEGEASSGTAKTVLIADDDSDVAQLLAKRLSQIGVHAVRTCDALHALVGIHKLTPDMIIMDVNMPSGNGLAVCEMLATDLARAKVPVIVYTGRADEETIRRCRELHLHYVHKAPGSWDFVRAIVCELLELQIEPMAPAVKIETAPMEADCLMVTEADVLEQAAVDSASLSLAASRDATAIEASEIGASQSPLHQVSSPTNTLNHVPSNHAGKRFRVLVIDDDPDISRALSLRLRPYGIDVIRTFSGLQGFWTGLDELPDLIITDMKMPDGEGNYIFGRFKSHPLTENIPIIVVTGQDSPGLRRQMLSLGASAYLMKPVAIEDLLHQMRQYLDLPHTPIRAARSNGHAAPLQATSA